MSYTDERNATQGTMPRSTTAGIINFIIIVRLNFKSFVQTLSGTGFHGPSPSERGGAVNTSKALSILVGQ